MQEKEETIEDCIRRELYEETGLSVKKVLKILPPSYSAVGFSDTKTYIAFVEADGVFSDHTSDNEEISARFYSREEVKALLETQSFLPVPRWRHFSLQREQSFGTKTI